MGDRAVQARLQQEGGQGHNVHILPKWEQMLDHVTWPEYARLLIEARVFLAFRLVTLGVCSVCMAASGPAAQSAADRSGLESQSAAGGFDDDAPLRLRRRTLASGGAPRRPDTSPRSSGGRSTTASPLWTRLPFSPSWLTRFSRRARSVPSSSAARAWRTSRSRRRRATARGASGRASRRARCAADVSPPPRRRFFTSRFVADSMRGAITDGVLSCAGISADPRSGGGPSRLVVRGVRRGGHQEARPRPLL